MLQALERGFSKFGIDYYLIGAVSKDVWMRGVYNFPTKRATRDIDFAIFINEKGIYEQLSTYLVNEEGFTPIKDNAFALIWEDGVEVDLMPFGAIEDENRKVTVEGIGYTSIHVDGFKEVYDAGLPQIELENHHQFKFCTIPGIVLLKLIAWDDRPERRRDDILDISDILRHFFEMNQDNIYNHNNDLFSDEQHEGDISKELLEIAAQVMGRELKTIVQNSEVLIPRIKKILDNNIQDAATSNMAHIMIEYFDNTLEDNVKIIKAIRLGLE
jgi:predicted nucleotidyltransferase